MIKLSRSLCTHWGIARQRAPRLPDKRPVSERTSTGDFSLWSQLAQASRDLELMNVQSSSVAVFWSQQSGLPPITGRIVGWLMISESPEQSAGEIAAAIGASRASLTTSMRLLMTIGLVHSVTRPGQRTIYYRIDDDAWEKMLRRRIANMASFREITRAGLTLLGENEPRNTRIRAADQAYEWAESVFAAAPPCPSTKPKTSS